MADSIIDPFKQLNIKLNPNGSLTRPNQFPIIPPSSLPNTTTISKDIPLDPSNQTFIRLYKPYDNTTDRKLPIMIYAHGGGFILLSAASKVFHDWCCRMSAHLSVFILSIDYRLAPEHRLPAAYDDAAETIAWLSRQADGIHGGGGGGEPWLKTADFSRCFLYGNSAGGNIAFHAGLRALDSDLCRVKIAGHIYEQPFFGGSTRTESELRLASDRILPLPVSDLMWELALPKGCDRSHWYCDPTAEGPHQEKIGRLPRCMVRGYNGDPLIDRQREFVRLLESRGVHVEGRFFEGGFHGVELIEPSKLDALMDDVKDFIQHEHHALL